MSRTILTASAAFLGLLGVALMFAPAELGPLLGLLPARDGLLGTGLAAAEPATLPLELLAGALFAFGVLNGMGRGALYGGIYGRPIALGNFLLGFTAAAALFRGAETPEAWVLGGLFALQAAAFSWILFRARPWADGTTRAGD